MSDEETHEESEEIVFKEDAPAVTASPQMVTKGELDEIVEGWKVKFHQLSEGMRAIQKASCAASENFHTCMDELQKDSCARDGAQERATIGSTRTWTTCRGIAARAMGPRSAES